MPLRLLLSPLLCSPPPWPLRFTWHLRLTPVFAPRLRARPNSISQLEGGDEIALEKLEQSLEAVDMTQD